MTPVHMAATGCNIIFIDLRIYFYKLEVLGKEKF